MSSMPGPGATDARASVLTEAGPGLRSSFPGAGAPSQRPPCSPPRASQPTAADTPARGRGGVEMEAEAAARHVPEPAWAGQLDMIVENLEVEVQDLTAAAPPRPSSGHASSVGGQQAPLATLRPVRNLLDQVGSGAHAAPHAATAHRTRCLFSPPPHQPTAPRTLHRSALARRRRDGRRVQHSWHR